MKRKNFTIFLTALLMLIGGGEIWGQTTVTQTSFSSISGYVDNDAIVSYASYKGGGTSAPAVNGNQIRLYQNSSSETGGYIVIGVQENYVITSATIQSGMATTTGYKLVDSDPGSTTPAKNTFDVSDYSLSKDTDYTVDNISTRYIVFACFGTSSSSRLYVSKISITYASAGGTTTYTVTYDANGGVGTVTDANSPYEADATVTVLENGFTYGCHTFSKWNTAADGSGTDYNPGATFTISANTTLYAQWTQDTYTITYNANGGTGTMEDGAKNCGEDYTIAENGFTPQDGYAFVAWNTQSDGSGTAYAAGSTYSTDADLALYAQWSNVSYTVTFNPGSGTVTPASLSGVTINLSELTVTPPTGWTLYGWALEATDGATTSAPEIVSDPYTPTENVTLYAVYMKVEGGTTWTRVTEAATLLDGGTFIMGYEETANSGTLVPLRSDGANATTTANGYFYTGTTSGSSTDGTISMSSIGETSDYEIYITASTNTTCAINIQLGSSTGNFIGATSGGVSKNSGRLYTSGNSAETDFTPAMSATGNAFSLTSAVTGSYKYLKYNTGSPRYACYNSSENHAVFYKKSGGITTYNSNPSANGPAATPTFSLAQESWYYSTQSLALSCSTNGATIYYTTDGTEPTASSTEYTAPISVSTTTTIKAIAYAENYDPSEIASATYNIMPNIARTCVIAYNDGEKYYAMSQTANGTRLGSVEVEPNEGVVTTSANAGLLWTIENTTNGVAIRPYNTTDYLNIADLSLTITSTEDYFKVIESTNTTGTYHFQDLSSNYAIEYYSNLFTGYGLTIGGTAFEMYLLDYELSTSYTIAVLNDLANGSIACELETAAENDLVTVTVTPDEGYRLATLYYYTNDPESTTAIDLETKTFNMPAANVTIGATFEAIPHLTIVLHANGNTSNWDVEQNATVELPQADAPNGYVFLGWVESDTHGLEDIIQSPHTFTANGDLYALFATISSIEYSWDLVTDASTFAEEDEFLLYGQKSDGTTNNVAGSLNGSYLDAISIDAPTNNTIQKPDGAEVFTMKAGTDGKWIFKSSEGKYLKSSNKSLSYVDNEPTEWSISIISSTGDATISGDGDGVLDFNPGSPRFKTYASSLGYTAFYRKTVIVNYSNISMSVNEISGTLATNEYNQPCYIGGPTTIPNGVTITFTAGLGNTNPANLVIEDGGQLIINNAGVQATVQKNISAYTNNEGTDNYYFIGSPVAENVAGQFAQGTYDLYKYDEATTCWKNYEAANFDIELGYGYLYANNEGRTVGMVGEVNVGTINITDLSYTTGSLAGFHLFGNPYTHDIYYGEGFVLAKDYSGYYVPNAAGELVVKEMTEPVKAGQGFMMQIVEGGDEIEFNNTNAAPTAKRAAKQAIQLTVGNGQFEDKAYFVVSKGYGLGKLSHFNENAPMLWVRNGNADYAIATTTEMPNSIPVSFKAGSDGTYTLSVDAKGLDADYLHLIDHVTGADVDLLSTPSYTFEARKTDYAARFRIVFSQEAPVSDGESFAYVNGGRLVIENEGAATVQITDMTGRVLRRENIQGGIDEALNLKPGMYIVSLLSQECVRSQKLVVE